MSSSPTLACRAPLINLHFLPNGDVRTCSRSGLALGNITESSIDEIWAGRWRRQIAERLAAGDFSAGCQSCELEFATEGRAGSIAAQFDVGPGGDAAAALDDRPRRFDFMLSNACNLQCVQCHGGFSSAIRLHREQLPPIVSPYGEEFLDQLVEHLPHLEGAQFAGGEPFLVPINFRIWDLIGRHAPDLECFTITNGTRWTPKVARALDQVRSHIVVSIDGIDKATYEALRIGADLDQVLENVAHLRRYTESVGTTLAFNFCLMPQNHQDLAPLLRYAEALDIPVNVLPVREPRSHAVEHLHLPALEALVRSMRAQAPLVAGLERNRAVWDQQLERVEGLLQARAQGTEAPERLVMLTRRRTSPAAAAPAAPAPADAYVATVADALRHGCSSSLSPTPTEVLEQLLPALGEEATSGLGELRSHEVLVFDDDQVVADLRFERGRGTFTLIAERDAQGWASTATVRFEPHRSDEGGC